MSDSLGNPFIFLFGYRIAIFQPLYLASTTGKMGTNTPISTPFVGMDCCRRVNIFPDCLHQIFFRRLHHPLRTSAAATLYDNDNRCLFRATTLPMRSGALRGFSPT